ncbi:hypothetical protein QU481_01075 [Crenobacter sp. SG2303]|uniref:Phosphoglycerate mutase n=1 Tax=Crenobacter oryzisoli TaxID=3056844 RepID=A0ABT7XI88_9NEIS|nr:hypothetical protein [Crenobacter sp. SG2303]MDN0073491.1 hypothetical protein [Crenobacter sp. SG2303]
MMLTLHLPGLAWLDAHDADEVAKGLELPALATLLGRGRVVPAAQSLSSQTAQAFALADTAPARSLAQADGLSVGNGHWLVADPVHVRIDRDRALLADIGILTLAQHEADRLTAALNQHFAEDGLRFHAPQPGRWYVESAEAPRAEFTALADVVGEDVNAHLPKGQDGLIWSRFLNELQMLLYTHPANDEREARGEPAVNSVWLWGNGEAGQPACSAKLVLADDPLWQHYATLAGVPHDAVPYAYDGLQAAAGKADSVLLRDDSLLGPAQYRDAWGWREGLGQLEERWFAPLLTALKARRLTELTLVCHGDAGFTLTVRSGDLWKFWRRPRTLASLV